MSWIIILIRNSASVWQRQERGRPYSSMLNMCSYFGDLLTCPLNFRCSFIIIFPSPSGKLTPKKCIGGMASLKLSKAEAVRLVRCLNCQATAYICVISVKYQEFIRSYLVLKKKDLPLMSPFLLSYVPPHTPHPIYCPS